MTRKTFFIAALLAGALIVSACGDDDAATTTSPPETTEATSGGAGTPYPQSFIDSYMEGCTSEASTEACQCTIDEFERRYALDEFVEIATSADEDDPRVQEVINFCLTNG